MIELPKRCYVGKFIAKKTFYDKLALSSSLKEDFTNKLERITWLYKLSSDTVGISKTDNVEEIEVFQLDLKEKKIPFNIIKAITKKIPYKILFIIKYKEDFCYAIKIEEIYNTDWNEKINIELNAINLEILYKKIVKTIIKEESNDKSFDEILNKKNRIDYLTKEIEKQKIKVKNEKQFDRKVELNNELNKMKKELEELINE